jgi:hypothetical protein
MTERVFRFIVGAWLLVALYFNLPGAIYALIGVLIVEGLTNQRVPAIVARLRGVSMANERCGAHAMAGRFAFEAERALRLLFASLLIVSYVVLHDTLWFFPWVIGFGLVGAGLSGVCPMVLSLRAIGLR